MSATKSEKSRRFEIHLRSGKTIEHSAVRYEADNEAGVFRFYGDADSEDTSILLFIDAVAAIVGKNPRRVGAEAFPR